VKSNCRKLSKVKEHVWRERGSVKSKCRTVLSNCKRNQPKESLARNENNSTCSKIGANCRDFVRNPVLCAQRNVESKRAGCTWTPNPWNQNTEPKMPSKMLNKSPPKMSGVTHRLAHRVCRMIRKWCDATIHIWQSKLTPDVRLHKYEQNYIVQFQTLTECAKKIFTQTCTRNCVTARTFTHAITHAFTHTRTHTHSVTHRHTQTHTHTCTRIRDFHTHRRWMRPPHPSCGLRRAILQLSSWRRPCTPRDSASSRIAVSCLHIHNIVRRRQSVLIMWLSSTVGWSCVHKRYA